MANIGSLIASIGVDTNRLDRDARKTQSVFGTMARNVIRNLVSITVAIIAIRKAFRAVNSTIRAGLTAIEKYKLGVSSLAAITLTFMKKTKPIPELWKTALDHAKNLFPVLEDISATTLLTGQQTLMLATEFAKAGQVIDVNNKKQVQGLRNISNALFVAVGGLDIERQIITEISAITRAMIRPNDKLGKLILAINPSIKEQVKLWTKNGVLIEKLGEQLSGFKPAVTELARTFAVMKTTLQTTVERILRGGMLPIYEDLIDLAIQLNDWAVKNKESIQEGMVKAYKEVRKILKDIIDIMRDAVRIADELGVTLSKAVKILKITVEAIQILSALRMTGGLSDTKEVFERMKKLTKEVEDLQSLLGIQVATPAFLRGILADLEKTSTGFSRLKDVPTTTTKIETIVPIDPEITKKALKQARFFVTGFEVMRRKEIDKTTIALQEAALQNVSSAEETAIRMAEIDAFRNDALRKLEIERLEFFKQKRQEELDAMIEHSQIFGDVVTAQIESWSLQVESFAQTIGSIITGIFDMVAQGIGDSVADAIVEGTNLVEGLKTLAKDVLKFIISTLVKMGVQRLILAVLNKTVGASEHVTRMSQLAAQTFAAAFAATAAIPIVGPELALGVATAATATMLAGSSVAAGTGAATGAVQGVAHAGIDHVPKTGTFLLDEGERVLDSRLNEDLKSFLGGGGGRNVTIEMDGAVLARALIPFLSEAKGDSVIG